MKNFIKTVLFVGFVLFFTSCEKDEQIVTPVVINPPKDTTTAVVPPVDLTVKNVTVTDSVSGKKIDFTFAQTKNSIKSNSNQEVLTFEIKNLPEGYQIRYTMQVFFQMYGSAEISNFFDQDSLSFEDVKIFQKTKDKTWYMNTYKGYFQENKKYFINLKTKPYNTSDNGVVQTDLNYTIYDSKDRLIKSGEFQFDYVRNKTPLLKFEP